ncbi:hypothetical protein [Alkalicoccobacillus murimartini]|uniref:DUF3888 domain-containing protein n=1 Tax=Alkalicoccobacillus murimartini TaxID=171685 RepID=A0ABT9YE84_9BACI|nr:hypothetical protein [Alkalicoccobacillus murimartini]MDQ0206148.1 hypothetical protein [Alkalicoccobacillus murimartini]
MKIVQCSLLLLLLILTPYSVAQAETQIINQTTHPSLVERAFLRSLGTSVILDVMSSHGDKQQYYGPRIEKVIRDDTNDMYDISLRVIGFEGPHNPPYTLIKMTIRIPGNDFSSYTVLDYTHNVISSNEAKKLLKFAPD